ncbi:MAG: hypothetical protein HGA90_03015 [Alphaproteobacteria bacterium]|nr:hypothetical protein [Alphaproteobacteria bacterium]
MSRRSIWEIFLKESYRTFCARGADDMGHVAAYKNLHEDVIDNGLSPQEALRELSDPLKVSDRLGEAYKIVREQSFQEGKLSYEEFATKALDYEKLRIEIMNLISALKEGQKENALLHKKLDKSHEMLEASKKRVARNFRIGLAVSVSGIAFGAAMRFGYLDGAKGWFGELFSSRQPTPEQKSKTSFQPLPASSNAPSVSSFDAVLLKTGPYGPHDPLTNRSMLDLLDAGRTVTLPFDRAISVRLGPNAPTGRKSHQSARPRFSTVAYPALP